MNKNAIMFLVSVVVATVTIGWVAGRIASPSFTWAILGSLGGATVLSYYMVQKAGRDNFIRNYLTTIVAKLLGSGIFISILIYVNPDGAEANAILFMAAYFVLTVLEVAFLFNRLK